MKNYLIFSRSELPSEALIQISSRSEWEAFKKKHPEVVEQLNADPKLETWIEYFIKLNEEHEREGPTFMGKYLDPNYKPKKWSED